MRVVGPAVGWESAEKLQAAIKDLPGDRVLYYGTAGRVGGKEQFQRMAGAGLAVPVWTGDVEVAKSWVGEGKEVWGRKNLHSQGRDIQRDGQGLQRKCIGKAEKMIQITTRKGAKVFRPRMVFIPSRREFRQHIFDGQAIRVGEKQHQGGGQPDGPLVRSRRNGWTIQYPPALLPPKGLKKLAKAAVAAVGYLFGAVDILEGMDGKLYVLEVNSAPSLKDPNTLQVYVDAITRWVKGGD